MKISSIYENTTAWEINYTRSGWVNRADEFSATPIDNASLIYFRNPLNYTQKHNLTNLFPFVIPTNSYLYLSNANLTNDYVDFYFDNYYNITEIKWDSSEFINGHYI